MLLTKPQEWASTKS